MELSKEQLGEIVTRVTANVLEEMKRNEATHLNVPEIQIHVPGLSEVAWAPWTVALPRHIRIVDGQAPLDAAEPE